MSNMIKYDTVIYFVYLLIYIYINAKQLLKNERKRENIWGE
jgi:hypothetical protein